MIREKNSAVDEQNYLANGAPHRLITGPDLCLDFVRQKACITKRVCYIVVQELRFIPFTGPRVPLTRKPIASANGINFLHALCCARRGTPYPRLPTQNSVSMKYLDWFAALTLSCAVFVNACHATVSTLATPRGAVVEMLVDMPEGTGPHAVLILAPGQGYHARLPLMERLSKDLVERGVAVVRFNWAYFVKDAKTGKPSDDLSLETEDMQTVLAATKKLPRIDAKRVAVGGKSLGSLVSWRVFRDDVAIRAAVLLTPVCVDYQTESLGDATLKNYPSLSANTRPLLLVSGDEDPLCPNRFLYGAAQSVAAGARVIVSGGNHNFATKLGSDPARESDANLDLVIRATTEFVTAKLR